MKIAVLFTHWPRHSERLEYFIRSVHAARRHLMNFITELEWWVTIESADAHWRLIQAAVRFCGYWHIKWIGHHGAEPSLGACLNKACDEIEAPYVLYIQDDFMMKAPLPLDADVAWMEAHPDFIAIRYSAHSKTLKDTIYLEGNREGGPPLLRQLDQRAFGAWSYQPVLLRLSMREILGEFSEDVHSEHRMTCRYRGLSADQIEQAKIAVRGWSAPGFPIHTYFAHIGTVPCMPKKYAHGAAPLTSSGSHNS